MEARNETLQEAKAAQRKARILAGLGLLGVYVTWCGTLGYAFSYFVELVSASVTCLWSSPLEMLVMTPTTSSLPL